MYNSKPVMQTLEKDEGAGGEISFETVIRSKTGCLSVYLLLFWLRTIIFHYSISENAKSSPKLGLEVWKGPEGGAKFLRVLRVRLRHHFLFAASAAAGGQRRVQRGRQEEHFCQHEAAWSIQSYTSSTAPRPYCCNKGEMSVGHRRTKSKGKTSEWLSHRCSPWFTFRRRHQFDHLQQQEGETGLEHTN